MITPTGVTASAYWNAIKSGNPTHVRLSFENQGIVLEDEDIDISSGITLTDIFNGDTDLVFGKAVSKEIRTSILNTSKLNGLVWTGEFKFEMGVEIGGSTNWVTIGYFSGEKPNNVTSVNTIDFTAYDRMVRFDILCDPFVESISYPITLQNIYNSLCSYVGLQNVSGDELPTIMSRSFASAPADIAGYTCRDILKLIAEACGCYATINEVGKVQLVWFTDNTGHSITGNEEYNVESADVNDGMTWDEADTYTWNEFDQFTWNDVCGFAEEYSIDRILVKQLNSDIDIVYPEVYTDGNTYMIADNPFLNIGSYSDVTNYIVPLYNRMIQFGGYLPVNLNCIGNWCVEAGDIVSIEVQSQTITVPIFVKTMRWNGAINDEYETTGNKVRDVYVSIAQKQQILNNREIRLFVEGNYYGIKSGIDITSDGIEISGNKYVQIKSGSSIDIQSGGNLNVESGGNININASGNLKLSGSVVEIKSGSTFDVDATNFKIDSVNKYLQTGYWKFDEQGAHCTETNLPSEFQIGNLNDRVSHSVGLFYTINTTANKASRIVLYAGGYNSSANAYYESGLNFYSVYNNGNPYMLIFPRSGTTLRIGQDAGASSKVEEIWSVDCHATKFYGTYDATGENIISTNGYVSVYPRGTTGKKIQLEEYTYNGTTYTKIWGSGTMIFEGTVQSPSSRDIKHDIHPLDEMGDKIDRLRPVSFVYDNDGGENKHYGLIYEDAVDVMSQICSNNESSKGINYMELIPVLLKEIQSLRTRVKELEEREV